MCCARSRRRRTCAFACTRRGTRRWRDVRVVLGAIAPTPWRARATERALEGHRASAEDLHQALDAELDREGHPLARNAWKLDAALGLATRVSGRLAPPA